MNSLGVGWAGGLVGVPEFKKKSFITQYLMQCLASAKQNLSLSNKIIIQRRDDT